MSIKELNKFCKDNNKAILVRRGMLGGFLYDNYEAWYFGEETQ